MSRWLWLCLIAVLMFAGCQHDQVVLLNSTPTRSPSQSPVCRTPAPRLSTPRTASPSRQLAEHSRRDWAQVAPIAMRLEPMGKITRITVHHSGEVNDMNAEEQIISHLRATQSSQCRSQVAGGLGAGDLAYHFVVDRNGDIWEGRSLSYQGAHAGNSTANRGNIGICVLGNFNVQYPNDSQKDSLKALLARLVARYLLAQRDIYTHREIRAYYGLSATDCPGTHLQSVVDAMRRSRTGGASIALAGDTRR